MLLLAVAIRAMRSLSADVYFFPSRFYCTTQHKKKYQREDGKISFSAGCFECATALPRDDFYAATKQASSVLCAHAVNRWEQYRNACPDGWRWWKASVQFFKVFLCSPRCSLFQQCAHRKKRVFFGFCASSSKIIDTTTKSSAVAWPIDTKSLRPWGRDDDRFRNSFKRFH